jgi:hypothetical protein
MFTSEVCIGDSTNRGTVNRVMIAGGKRGGEEERGEEGLSGQARRRGERGKEGGGGERRKGRGRRREEEGKGVHLKKSFFAAGSTPVWRGSSQVTGMRGQPGRAAGRERAVISSICVCRCVCVCACHLYSICAFLLSPSLSLCLCVITRCTLVIHLCVFGIVCSY